MFKIGDKVKIKSEKYFDNLNNGEYPFEVKNIWIQPEMKKYFGTDAVLKETTYIENHFYVKENTWAWAYWMFEKIPNKDKNGNYLLEF